MTTHYLTQRRSIRLKNYDYSQQGLYFVTICTQSKICYFGEIQQGENRLNPAGLMVENWFYELEHKFPYLHCDAFVCMPNHVHFIVEKKATVTATSSLSQVVQWYKTMTTNAYIRGVKQQGWAGFEGKLWQRNYYEHIIRNDIELTHIRDYIQTNPLQWQNDQLHPNHTT